METKRFDGTDVRKILASMVSDQMVLSRVAGQWVPEGLFAAEWANLIGGLVVDYFQKYNKPPRRQIISIFEQWAKTTPAPDAEVESVERFLRGVFDEEHSDAPEYVLDVAGNYFNKVAMQRACEAVGADLDVGRVDEAQQRLEKFRRVNLGAGSFTVLGEDENAWLNAFSREYTRPLISYRGALNDFIGDSFQRGRLLSFMASEKVGKTAWLVDAAYRAAKNFCNIAYFDTGDGEAQDLLPRLACRLTGRAYPYAGTFPIPIDWSDEEVVYEDQYRELAEPIAAFQELRENLHRPDAFRTSYHPSGTLSVSELDATLWRWEQESGWVPDVVIIDYADLIAPNKGVKDKLDQIDDIWSSLHRLAQQRHCLVVTATQASAMSYGNEGGLLSKKHFSGRKTKLAHVNGMLGINISPEEKEKGLARINWIVRRGAAYNERHFVRVVGQMAIASPAILSKKWEPEKSNDKSEQGQNG